MNKIDCAQRSCIIISSTPFIKGFKVIIFQAIKSFEIFGKQNITIKVKKGRYSYSIVPTTKKDNEVHCQFLNNRYNLIELKLIIEEAKQNVLSGKIKLIKL